MAANRGPFHAPPQLKPRYEVKSGEKRHEGSRTEHKGTVCEQGRRGKAGIGYAVLLYVGRERDVKAGE